ncbi:MAG TPA: PD-(D/E)XK nuclease family transposase [Saprospiraceae bacterium]|nr:PD-(D/E)XK nuclease family transposase [Saprospiraceae bacterium]
MRRKKRRRWSRKSTFENFPKIYCIGILGFDLFPIEHYHTNACLRDENGRVIDNQTEYIFVELGKFDKKGEIKGVEKEKFNNIRKIILAVDWDDAKIADVFETTPEAVAQIRAELKV